MSDLAKRIAALSPEQRKLLEMRLKKTAVEIEPHVGTEEQGFLSPIKQIEEREYYPASSAQKRLFILNELEGENTTYNMPALFLIDGLLDEKRFGEAFSKLVERHESLRTSFDLIDGEPVQFIHKAISFQIDHQIIAEDELESNFGSFVRPFDLKKAPLLRAKLLRLTNGKQFFLFDMHHIISDGVSAGILVRELIDLYAGKELPELKIQYKDFSVWQNDLLQNPLMKKREEYWLNVFSGEIPTLNLLTDYPRSAIRSFEGDSVSFDFEKEETSKLYKLITDTGTTLYMVLLAAYSILLAKYTEQEDIVVGLPIAGRTHEDLKNIIGMFVNTLAIRTYPQGNKKFRDYLAEVKKTASGAYDNQDYPFDILIDKLNLQRDTSRNPVFDSVLTMHNTNIPQITMDGLRFIHQPIGNKISKFDLTVNVGEADGKILFDIEYCTKLFRSATIERLGKHFLSILRQLIANPEVMISQIEMLTDIEKEQLLNDFNGSKVEFTVDKTLQDLFTEQAEKFPDNIAVVNGEDSLTYRELDEKSNQLARALREYGVKPETIVGIMVERSLEMVVGIFGILKAGGAYLPVDPQYPEDRIQYMLQDSGADILLTQGSLADRVGFTGRVIDLGDQALYKGDRSRLEKINKPEDLAYVIYTSGTTGKPKGVLVEHGKISQKIQWRKAEYALDEKDNVLQLFSYSFDGFLTSFFTPMIAGSKVVLLSDMEAKDAIAIKDCIAREKITHFICVPALYGAILECISKKEAESLRVVTLAGDKVTGDIIAKSKAINGKLELVNEYGPTENSVVSTMQRDLQADKEITIGKPVANSSIYILDKNNRLVPIGIAGEICIGGEGLARGYLNRPELTAEKFIANPYVPGERLYKTGDLARWLSDGNIDFIGRIDHQVKIRGFRIELGEIENQLLEHAAVREAVVIAKDGENGNKYLCAYLSGDGELKSQELREYLGKTLPDYMVPSFFIQLEKLPLTPNGKVDRKALPEPDGKIDTGVEYLAPRNEIEAKLVEVWQEVLGIEKIGVNDNFFSLGGHSLKATVLAAKIHKQLNVEVPLQQIFKIPTIGELAKYIDGAKESIYAAIQPVEAREYYPVSAAQRRLFIVNQLEDGKSTAYNIPAVVVVEGHLDKNRFAKTFQELVKRHESFRTSFKLIDGEVVQTIADHIDFQVSYSDVEESQLNEAVEAFIEPFNLEQAPLLRVGLLRISETKHLLVYDMHHIIADGVSLEILVGEFIALYNGESLPGLRIQYKDFTIWQNDLFKSEVIKKQEEYWLRTFSGEIPVLNLPTDYPRPLVQSFEGGTLFFTVDRELTKALNDLAGETGSTMFMVLLAAFNVLLAKYSGQEDIIVGSPTAGRPHADLQNIMGMFVNTLAIRNYVSMDKEFREFLAEVRTNALEIYENQDYQFEELIEKLDIKRDLGRNPLFDVMLAMQNTDTGNRQGGIDGLKFMPYERENKVAKFDLTLRPIEVDGEIHFTLEYCAKLFKPERIELFGKHFINILKEITTKKEMKISDIEIMSQEEIQQLLVGFNNTTTDYPKDKLVHELFEMQSLKTPDNIAVVYQESKFTYGQLNIRANQLAHQLRQRGVGNNASLSGKDSSIVAIMAERSLEMVVAILGVLKAGAAYLPIDPEFPDDRVNYILQDSKACLLLTQKPFIDRITADTEVLDLAERELYTGDSSTPVSTGKPDELAYVIYTSGTTGMPKGVMLEHNGLVNYATWFIGLNALAPGDKTALLSSYAFDLGYTSLYPALLSGCELHIVAKETYTDADELLAYIKRNQLTFIKTTPSLFNVLVNAYSFSESEICASLRLVVLGGEQINTGDIAKYHAQYPQAVIMNHYGPTETTIGVIAQPIDFNAFDSYRDVPTIGRPINNTQVYILDKSLKPVPFGTAGEIYIGGAGLARGYLNRQELTAEKFVSNPFGTAKGNRLYKTGDLGRYLSDGRIEFLGRVDHQVKIRGYRVELGEIENSLLGHADINDAVVILTEAGGIKTLNAYFVSTRELTPRELREFLGRELPDYMVPAHFMQLDKIPLTPNGKVDRKALPKIEVKADTENNYMPPQSEKEEKLANIWIEVLGVANISVNDNFFELGGDSIKAIQVMSRLRRYNLKLTLKELFEHPTIAELSPFLTVIKEKADQGIVTGRVALTPIQKWLFTNDPTDVHHRNHAVMLYNRQGFDAAIFKKVFTKIVEHHDALRMVYQWTDGEIIQFNRGLDDNLFSFDVFDFTNTSNYSESILEKATKIQQSIDLANGPLVKLALFKTGEGDHLLIVINHLVVDGVSWRIIFEDIAEGYLQATKQQEIVLQEKTHSFKEWAERLQAYANSREFLKETSYWLQQEKQEVLHLPKDAEVESNLIKDSKVLELIIAKDDTEKLLNHVSKLYNTEINDILLTALGLAVKEWAGRENVLIMLEGHGREEIIEGLDITRTIGWFTTLYPVILDMKNSDDLGYQIKYIKETLRRIPNKGIGYGLLKYLASEENRKQLCFNLKPEIGFNYLGQFDQDIKEEIFAISSMPAGPSESLERQRKYTFDINGMIAAGELHLTFEYNKYQYNEETVQKLLNSYKKNLLKIIEHCTGKQEVELTPADLGNKNLSLEEFDDILDLISDL